METTTRIADVILDQLGGNRFLAMTGAKYLLDTGDGLSMTIPRNVSKANRLKITLNGLDLYDVEFTRYTPERFYRKTGTMTPDKWETVKVFNGVYCDQLQELFTSVTGMYTHL